MNRQSTTAAVEYPGGRRKPLPLHLEFMTTTRNGVKAIDLKTYNALASARSGWELCVCAAAGVQAVLLSLARRDVST